LRAAVVGDDEVHHAAGQVGQRRRGALVRNHAGLAADQRHQPFAGDLVGGAAAAVIEFARVLAGRLEQLLGCLVRRVGRHEDAHGSERQARNRRQVLQRVIRQLVVQGHVGGHRPVGGEQQRLAVRRGGGDQVGRDDGIAAGAVLDQHGLPQLFAQALRRVARHRVRAGSGRIRHDQAYRAGRILRQGRARHQGQAQQGRAQGAGTNACNHGESPRAMNGRPLGAGLVVYG